MQAGEDPTQAIEKAELAFTIASAIGDFNLQVQANHFLGTSHRMIGDYDRAIYHFKKNVDSLVGDQIYDRFGLAFLASVGSRFQLVEILSDRGEFNEAAIHGDEAVRIAEVANHPFSLNTAYLAVGYLHFRKGDWNKAIALLERSMEICRVWDIRQNFPRVAVALGNALAATGRVGEAMPLLELTNERARNSWMRVQLAQGYLLVGKLEEATSIANQVLESSQTQGYAVTQRCHFTFSPRVICARIFRRWRKLKIIMITRWHWLMNFACARSSRTATSVLENYIGAPAITKRLRRSSPTALR